MSFEVPEVTIIVPLYNAEKYIEQTMMSVQQQTFTDFEVIVVDDCSTDRSTNIVEAFKKTGELRDKIQLIRLEKNGGIGSTRNIGLRMSRSRYVMFLDNDDFLLPTTLDTFVATARKYDADVVHTHAHFQNRSEIDENATEIDFTPSTYEHGNRQKVQTHTHALTNDMSERIKDFTRYKIDWNVWGKLFRRDFLMLNDIKFPVIPYTEDLLFTFQCVLQAKKYIMIPNLLYVYRVRSSSTLRKERGESFLKKIIETQLLGTKLINKYMDKHEYFKNNKSDYFRMINFYVQLEMMSTKLMQQNLKDEENYYEQLTQMYSEQFGKNSSWTAYLHILANEHK